MSRFLTKLLLLLLLLSNIYLEEIFIGEINILGSRNIKESILFINAGLYPKEKYDAVLAMGEWRCRHSEKKKTKEKVKSKR